MAEEREREREEVLMAAAAAVPPRPDLLARRLKKSDNLSFKNSTGHRPSTINYRGGFCCWKRMAGIEQISGELAFSRSGNPKPRKGKEAMRAINWMVVAKQLLTS